ncbi:N,N'-diacetylchitobiose phosphorylase [Salana multivorans]|uniref:N,N'-diacetylchitobiose phosphorylase n=1 Tax=Salana multivorans TaxID=120377 RepID=A0A3N2D761_9MICO|nr:N,N'-diacetylchitobiose phosphorylase [Salana multivorans]OJX98227.1 MAG: N,N'-diacetylchitobiose phosphorylase [Micrococcales bacterium 73-15]ROR95613.1 N,N'-diacetylchitobiose phosphorylase [Salana multivorans]
MKYGYFDTAADEYVVTRPDVPASWTNYLGTKDFATVIAHHGGAYSYYRSPQTGRITRFRPNGVPMDGPGHYVYLRDDADGDFWSVSWQPVGKPFVVDDEDGPSDPTGATDPTDARARYTAAHGLGYTRFSCDYRGIEASQTVFVPLEDDVEVWDVHVRNTSDVERRLTLGTYLEFSFHTITIDNQNLQMSLYASGSDYADGIIEYDFHYEPWTFHFFTSSREPSSYDCSRDAFIGPYRTERNPLAIERGHGSGSSGTTQNSCGSLFHELVLAPGESVRLAFVLGYGSRDGAGRAMRAKYADPATVDAELAALRAHWADKQSRLRITTPHEGMDTMINTWTLLQAETCVQWSRFASFVEVGGRVGLGYRDTAQDVMSVPHSNPVKTRSRILELLRAQTEAGYGLHLFEPAVFDPDHVPLPDVPSPTIVPRPDPASLIHGLEDTCSDDHLWLVPSVVAYVAETGDVDLLGLEVPFAEGTPATVYEHLRRALEFSAEHVGANGVALGLRADWNDCLNLGGGESSLVTFLHAWAIGAFLEVARFLGREDDVARWSAERDRIARVTEELWDGRWWLRGFTRDGVTIGSAANAEGKIFLEHQAWPIIAGIASRERGEEAMDAVAELLGSEWGSHLSWPAFRTVDDTVGFITRVYPGVKENAAIFSHPNAWPIVAEALLGRGDRAVELYDAILPYRQNDRIETRYVEPYAYTQFVYGRDHALHGRGQNPWLTGTAGWMYTAVTKYVLGVRPGLDGLTVDPAIPAAWPGFSMRREWRGAVYDIAVTNVGSGHGVRSVLLDGVEHPADEPIPAAPAGSAVRVEVTVG